MTEIRTEEFLMRSLTAYGAFFEVNRMRTTSGAHVLTITHETQAGKNKLQIADTPDQQDLLLKIDDLIAVLEKVRNSEIKL